MQRVASTASWIQVCAHVPYMRPLRQRHVVFVRDFQHTGAEGHWRALQEAFVPAAARENGALVHEVSLQQKHVVAANYARTELPCDCFESVDFVLQ